LSNDAQIADLLKELHGIGYTNQNENLRRIKKFEINHLENVIDDYEREPIVEVVVKNQPN